MSATTSDDRLLIDAVVRASSTVHTSPYGTHIGASVWVDGDRGTITDRAPSRDGSAVVVTFRVEGRGFGTFTEPAPAVAR